MKTLFFLFLTLPAFAKPLESKPLIHGHRGARAIYPENTLKAFAYALANHIDVLEMDMAITKDDVVVVAHDPLLNPDICLDPKGKKITSKIPIHSLTLAELKEYDCGTLKNPEFATQTPSPGEKIPTLEEVFNMVEASKDPFAKKIEFNIETKIEPNKPELSPDPKKFVDLFYAIIKKHNLQKRVILQSFDDRTLIDMKKLDPKIRTALLTSDNHIDYVAAVKAIHADILSPNWEWILPEDVQKLHAHHIQVVPWTADTPESWKKLTDMKVDAIISDNPKAVANFLATYGTSTDPQ
jgi:glycerophosphoryl diester phosphodiesterase